jgi:hypothetical protein
MLGLKIAYATNGRDIIELDYCTGFAKTLPGYRRRHETNDVRMVIGADLPDRGVNMHFVENGAGHGSPLDDVRAQSRKAYSAKQRAKPMAYISQAWGTKYG